MSKDLAVRDERRELSLMDVIQQAIATPGFDVGTLERIIALKERTDDQERRNAFAAAMSRLQAKLPQIDKRGKIIVQGQERSRYAKLEDLDMQIRPYLAEEGFAFSYDTEPAGNEIRIIGKLSHSAGHFELKRIDMPIDDGGAKSKVQQRGSTLTYGIRQLLKMHLNLVMRDEDNDGQGNVELVSAKDLIDIKAMIEKTDANLSLFLKFMNVEKLEDIQRRDVPRAMNALKAKAKRPE